MNEGTTGLSGLSGPAAVAASFQNIERHVQDIVRIAMARQELRGDLANEVAKMHDRIARTLDDIVRDHGTDAMDTAAIYGLSAVEAGMLYAGDELEVFMRQIARSVRSTSRALVKRGGGSIA